jgi:uncharacterized protein YkwD
MPRIAAFSIAVFLCGCALALATPAQAAPTSMELRLINRINEVRAAHGVRRLRIGPRLQPAAHEWAVHLRRSGSFYHGRLASGTSENLAWGTCSWFTPAAAVRMWMRSDAHRINLLRRGNRYVGAGVAVGRWRGYSCARIAVARFR